ETMPRVGDAGTDSPHSASCWCRRPASDSGKREGLPHMQAPLPSRRLTAFCVALALSAFVVGCRETGGGSTAPSNPPAAPAPSPPPAAPPPSPAAAPPPAAPASSPAAVIPAASPAAAPASSPAAAAASPAAGAPAGGPVPGVTATEILLGSHQPLSGPA